MKPSLFWSMIVKACRAGRVQLRMGKGFSGSFRDHSTEWIEELETV